MGLLRPVPFLLIIGFFNSFRFSLCSKQVAVQRRCDDSQCGENGAGKCINAAPGFLCLCNKGYSATLLESGAKCLPKSESDESTKPVGEEEEGAEDGESSLAPSEDGASAVGGPEGSLSTDEDGAPPAGGPEGSLPTEEAAGSGGGTGVCAGNPCGEPEAGSCIAFGGGYACLCNPKYVVAVFSGKQFCQPIGPDLPENSIYGSCARNPCGHAGAGRCVEGENGAYGCICNPGYGVAYEKGKPVCATVGASVCQDFPCGEGHGCLPQGDSYSCICKEGYHTFLADQDSKNPHCVRDDGISPCSYNPCGEQHAVKGCAKGSIGGRVCICNPGYKPYTPDGGEPCIPVNPEQEAPGSQSLPPLYPQAGPPSGGAEGEPEGAEGLEPGAGGAGGQGPGLEGPVGGMSGTEGEITEGESRAPSPVPAGGAGEVREEGGEEEVRGGGGEEEVREGEAGGEVREGEAGEEAREGEAGEEVPAEQPLPGEPSASSSEGEPAEPAAPYTEPSAPYTEPLPTVEEILSGKKRLPPGVHLATPYGVFDSEYVPDPNYGKTIPGPEEPGAPEAGEESEPRGTGEEHSGAHEGEKEEKKEGGSNAALIAGGVIGALVLVAGAGGGAAMYMRKSSLGGGGGEEEVDFVQAPHEGVEVEPDESEILINVSQNDWAT